VLQLQEEVHALAVADMAQQQRAAELAHTELAVQQELQVRVLDAKAALRAVQEEEAKCAVELQALTKEEVVARAADASGGRDGGGLAVIGGGL
jgi:hypothetical protein